MPLINVITTAENVCKLYPEKDDKSSFASLNDSKSDVAVEIKKLQKQVEPLQIKKNVVDVVACVMLVDTAQDKNALLIQIGNLEKSMKEIIETKSKALSGRFTAVDFCQKFSKAYDDFVDAAQEEINTKTNVMHFSPGMLQDDYKPAQAVIESITQQKPANSKLEPAADKLSATATSVTVAATATATASTTASASATTNTSTTTAIVAAQNDHKKNPHPRLQLDVIRPDLKEQNDMLEQKLAELSKKYKDLEKQYVDPKKYILFDQKECNKVNMQEVYKDLVKLYDSDLKFEGMYTQLIHTLRLSTRYANPESTNKLIGEIEKVYMDVSHFYRSHLFAESKPVGLTKVPSLVDVKESKVLVKPFGKIKEDIIELRNRVLRHGNSTVGAKMGLSSDSGVDKLKASNMMGGLAHTPSSVGFFLRNHAEDQRRLKIQTFFDELVRRYDPDEIKRVNKLSRDHGEFARRNAVMIKEQAIRTAGYDTILNVIYSTFNLMRK